MPPKKGNSTKSKDTQPTVEDLAYHEATEEQTSKALEDNPTGVYVIKPASGSFDIPSPLCVGYLRLKNTADYWDHMKPGNAIFDSLQEFQTSNHAYGFHCSTSLSHSPKIQTPPEAGQAPKHTVQVKVKNIFQAINSEDEELQALLDTKLPLPLDTKKLTPNATTRATWSYVVQMYSNMKMVPHLFDAGQEPPAPQSPDSPAAVTRFGYSMEDWNRSYVLIRTHQKAFHNATRASTGTGTRHHKPAVIPAFITQDDTREAKPDEDVAASNMDDPKSDEQAEPGTYNPQEHESAKREALEELTGGQTKKSRTEVLDTTNPNPLNRRKLFTDNESRI
jgi:hypothetical protein